LRIQDQDFFHPRSRYQKAPDPDPQHCLFRSDFVHNTVVFVIYTCRPELCPSSYIHPVHQTSYTVNTPQQPSFSPSYSAPVSTHAVLQTSSTPTASTLSQPAQNIITTMRNNTTSPFANNSNSCGHIVVVVVDTNVLINNLSVCQVRYPNSNFFHVSRW
jgi:hypothetical protein